MADLGMLIKVQAVGASGVEADIERVSTSADKLEKKSNSATKRVDELGRALEKTGKNAKNAGEFFDLAAKAAAGFVTLHVVRQMFGVADGYRAISERVKMATNNLYEFEYAQMRLSRSADISFRSLAEASELFIATSETLRGGYQYTLSEALDITDSLSFAFVRNATAADKAASAINTYDRVLSRGKMNGQEWQSISSGLDSLAGSIGDVFGKAADEIDGLGHSGQLAVEWLNEGLLKSLDSNRVAADSMANTWEDGLTRVEKKFTEVWGKFNQESGITSAATSSLIFFADHLELVGEVAMVVAVGGITFYTSKLLASGVAAGRAGLANLVAADSARMLRNSTIMAATATERQALLAMKNAQANIALGGSYSIAAARALDYARAVNATQAAYAMPGSAIGAFSRILGGPIGFISLAAAAASAMYVFSDSAKDTKVALDDVIEPIESIISKFKEMDEIGRIEFLKKTSDQELAAIALVEEGYESLLGKVSHSIYKLGYGIQPHNRLLREVKEEFKLAAETGEDLYSVIKRVSELTGVSFQEIIEQSDGLNGLIKQYNHYKEAKERALGVQKETDISEKSLTSNKEALAIYNEITQKMFDINSVGMEGVLITKKQMGELDGIDDAWYEILLVMAKAHDQQQLMKTNDEELTKLLADVKVQYDNIGKSVEEITRAKLIAKAVDLGINPEQLEELKSWLTAIGSAPKVGGKTSLNYFDDALKSINDELISTKALTQDLTLFGDPSQYTAFSEMTMQLNDTKGVLANITASQRELLIYKAQELDSQKQINAILELGRNTTQDLDDLEFEISLYGKSQKEIERLTFFRDLDNEARLISIGMTEDNIAVLNREIEALKERYGLIEMNREHDENSIGKGIESGFQQYIDNIGTMRDSFADATQSVFGNIEGFLVDFAHTGKLNFRDMTTSILQDLSRIMIQMAMMEAVTGMQGWLSGLGLFSGGGSVPISPGIPYQLWTGGHIPEYATGGRVIDFSGGGFTGMGGMFEPKGIVHGGEYVMSKAAVNNLGVGYFEQLHDLAKSGRGFANGGHVGRSSTQMAMMGYMPMNPPNIAQAKTSDAPINIDITIDTETGEVKTNATELSAEHRREINVMIDKRVAVQKGRSGGMLRG